MYHNIGYHVYADDTQLYISFKCKQPLKAISKLNSCLADIRKHRIVEGGPVSRHTLMLDDWELWSITALDGVPSVCLTNYLCLYVVPLYVLFIVSRNNLISTVPDSPCQPGFNNSLDHGDCLRWRTPRDGLAEN